MVVADEVLDLLGDFDPLKLGLIRRVSVFNDKNEFGEWACDVFVVVDYWPNVTLEVAFSGVKRVKIPEFGENVLLSFSELIVEDVKGFGLEGVNYCVLDHVSGFSCDCGFICVNLFGA